VKKLTKEEQEAKREFRRFKWAWAKYFFLPILVLWVVGWVWMKEDEATRAREQEVTEQETQASAIYQDSIEAIREVPRTVHLDTLTAQDSLELRMEGMQNKR
jgi:hypothetical protein